VAEEVAVTVGESPTVLTFILLFEARIAHGVVAGYPDNVVCIVELGIPSDIFGEGALLVAPLVLPLSAAGISLLGRTLGPCIEHVEGTVVVLRKNEACVEHRNIKTVSADRVAVIKFFRIVRESERGMLLAEKLIAVNIHG
jgi:hypothetical protein